MTNQIPFAILTGGPCAGKTTAKTFLLEKLADLGFYPLFRPEAPTLLMDGGVTPLGDKFPSGAFQRSVLRTTAVLDAEWLTMARQIRHPKPVIIGDRGLLDALPYAESKAEFEKMLGEIELKYVQARDEKYTGVFHLRTAALGAEPFYTLGNNAARYETIEQARERDQQTFEAWIGHEHLREIPNHGTFADKLEHLLAEFCVLLKIPEPVETERKFRVALPIPLDKLGAYQEIDIEQFYLLSNDPAEELRLRKRGQWGEAVYFETRKRPTPDGASRYETQNFTTAANYEFAKQFMIPGTHFVRKKRICFVYHEQYFELDRFIEPSLGYALLEIELMHPTATLTLPPFLEIEKEVTGDKRYSNRALANV